MAKNNLLYLKYLCEACFGTAGLLNFTPKLTSAEAKNGISFAHNKF